jgi:hypothetical protein
MHKLSGDRYEFVVTGDLSGWDLPRAGAVTFAGMIDDLSSFLSTVHGVCLLSPLGHGFKTTIGDSIAHGCHVLVHPALARRCPRILAPALIPVDSERTVDVARALDHLAAAPPRSELDSELRVMNHRILAAAFGLELAAPHAELLCQ